MKRDMDLCRKLLIRIESDERFNGTGTATFFISGDIEEEGHSNAEVAYHIALLVDAGFILGNTKFGPVISRLTWEGHEFLDNTRDPTVWKAVKDRARVVAGVGAAILLDLAKSELKKLLHLE